MDSSSTTQDSDGVAVSMDSSSFNLFSSTAAPTPLPEEVERELFLRCVFDDDALLETEELAPLARGEGGRGAERRGGGERPRAADEAHLADPEGLHADHHLHAQPHFPCLQHLQRPPAHDQRPAPRATPPRPSSPTHSLQGLQGLQGLKGESEQREAELVEMPETSAVQLRTKAEIERRTTMRMKSLHESEEITMSSSTPTGNSQKTEDKNASAIC